MITASFKPPKSASTFGNAMPGSPENSATVKTETRSASPRVAISPRPASPPRSASPPKRKRRTHDPARPTKYIRGLDAAERVDLVLEDLREKHRWSIKDFLHHMATSDSGRPYRPSPKTRTRRLAEAIQQKEVMERLLNTSEELREVGSSALVSRLRKEIQRIGKSEAGLGGFNEDTPTHDLDIPTIKERVQSDAPELCGLLLRLIEPHGRKAPAKDHLGSLTMMCSILAFASSPRKCNNFPVLLGLYLHAMGVKPRTMNVLSGLGIIPTYKTIVRKRGELTAMGKAVPLLSDSGEQNDLDTLDNARSTV
jgi:hypothetical protein